MIATVSMDPRVEKYTNGQCYNISINGNVNLKQQLFRLPTKKAKIEEWANNGKRKESNKAIAITSIESLGYSTPMTCFMVDNDEHLFLMNDYIVTHNTRIAVAQAVKCSIPIQWDLKKQKWAYSGCDEISGICTTEMGFDETQTMILATIAGIDESKIIESTMTDAEKKRVYQAAQILAKYEKNLYIWRMPDPNIKQLISGVRKMRLTHNLDNLFNSKDCVIPFQSVAGVI